MRRFFTISPAPVNGYVTQFKIVTDEKVESYVARGAVGIIAGRLIDSQGPPVLGEVDERLMGIAADDMRQMSGLLVAFGLDKRPAFHAVLNCGLRKGLL